MAENQFQLIWQAVKEPKIHKVTIDKDDWKELKLIKGILFI